MNVFRLIKSRSLIILATLMLSSITYASPPDKDILAGMENHWQKLINERDEQTRNKMIIEHRKMMEDAKNSTGITGHHDSHSGAHHHMLNTFDMHESIMDMME